jgi:hypothetical protein
MVESTNQKSHLEDNPWKIEWLFTGKWNVCIANEIRGNIKNIIGKSEGIIDV